MRAKTTFAAIVLAFLAAACAAVPAARSSAGPSSPAPTMASTMASATASEDGSPSPSSAAATPTFPPGPFPLESCGPIQHLQDGNIRPLFCPDGHPSLAADTFLRGITPKLAVLDLAVSATLAQVESAMCADKRVAHMTNPIEYSVYEIRSVEMGWNYAWAPEDWLLAQC